MKNNINNQSKLTHQFMKNKKTHVPRCHSIKVFTLFSQQLDSSITAYLTNSTSQIQHPHPVSIIKRYLLEDRSSILPDNINTSPKNAPRCPSFRDFDID